MLPEKHIPPRPQSISDGLVVFAIRISKHARERLELSGEPLHTVLGIGPHAGDSLRL